MSFASDILKTEEGRFVLSNLASVEDDLGDVSTYLQYKNPTSVTEYVLLDVADGPKTCLNIYGMGNTICDTAATANGYLGPVTVDGTVSDTFPGDRGIFEEAASDRWFGHGSTYPIRYDSSLKVEWEHNGSGNMVTAAAFVLGSGPHDVGVVRDGSRVYMTATNLSEATIEQMNVPKGYKIVKNPEIDHPFPQTRGMWDDDKEEVVDHPYWEPFHDTLERLDGMRRRAGSQKVLEKIERSPTGFENILEGENPMEDPVEEAVQFWYEREKEQGVSLSELEKIRER